MSINQSFGIAVEPQVPRSPSLGNADAANNDRDVGEPGRDATREVGMKEERLQQVGASLPQMSPEPSDDHNVVSASRIETCDRYPMLDKWSNQLAWLRKADDVDFEARSIQASCQSNKLSFGPPGIEFSDAQRHPWTNMMLRESLLKSRVAHRIGYLGVDGTDHRTSYLRDVVKVDFNAISSYDYELPADLIASEPTARRDDARLLVVDRASGTFRHLRISDLPMLLESGDRLVFNNTRVVPARLHGFRESTGGKWEGLFLRAFDGGEWEFLSQTRGRLNVHEAIVIPPADRTSTLPPLRIRLTGRGDEGAWRAIPESREPAFALLDHYGHVPLPPYIRKGIARPEDAQRYQTVFGEERGSVAAPTASLHFTHELLNAFIERSIARSFVTLHVGVGTFRPVAVETLDQHHMHSEWGDLSPSAAEEIKKTKQSGHRVVAVGTTSVRVLESAAETGDLHPFRGETQLFIRPPYQFHIVDVLLTNFHLPRSTLLVLVSTFGGYDLIREAYAEAIRNQYRFYSYGDAMLIL